MNQCPNINQDERGRGNDKFKNRENKRGRRVRFGGG